MMHRYPLSSQEIASAAELVRQLTMRFSHSESSEFMRAAALAAHELPRSLRAALYDFKLEEPIAGLLLVSGWPIDDAAQGPTPAHWKQRQSGGTTFTAEAMMTLVGSLLGDTMGWSTQQDGRLIHHVVPIREHQNAQLGSSSLEPLWWHSEDAFHAARPDYVILMCLRNPDRVATTYGSLENVRLAPHDVAKLFEPNYTIRPDNSHQPTFRGQPGYDAAGAYAVIDAMNRAPERIPVLHGDPAEPYLRLDPYFMEPVTHDPDAQHALDALVRGIEETLVDLVLEPGDIGIFDNYRAVHGRRSFTARFDGSDRWLQRILITRDLRRSRDRRRTPTGRILY